MFFLPYNIVELLAEELQINADKTKTNDVEETPESQSAPEPTTENLAVAKEGHPKQNVNNQQG